MKHIAFRILHGAQNSHFIINIKMNATMVLGKWAAS